MSAEYNTDYVTNTVCNNMTSVLFAWPSSFLHFSSALNSSNTVVFIPPGLSLDQFVFISFTN